MALRRQPPLASSPVTLDGALYCWGGNTAGQIGGPPSPPNTEFTYTVRTQGRLLNEAEFGNIIVRTNPDGSQVYLKDVARLELGTMLYNAIGRHDSKPAAVIAVFQIPGTNALQVAAQIKKTMDELSQRFPRDMEYLVTLDTTLPVEEGINEIVHTLFEAVALVILVVFVFLQNWRATLIPLITVPVSLIGTFMVFPLLGFSVNMLSLLGLVLRKRRRERAGLLPRPSYPVDRAASADPRGIPE